MRDLIRAGGLCAWVVGCVLVTGCAAEMETSSPALASQEVDDVVGSESALIGGEELDRLSVLDSEPDDRIQLGYGVTSNGRYLVFASRATNLVANDNNGVTDVFIVDRRCDRHELISVNPSGEPANGDSYYASISDDGRFVVFVSDATDLVDGDTNGVADVFVRDRWFRRTQRVSLTEAGEQSTGASGYPDISGNGQWVTFVSSEGDLVAGDSNGTADVFLTQWRNGTMLRVSEGPNGLEGDGPSVNPHIDYNGRYVVFSSTATNLVSDDTNGVGDVFTHDRATGQTARVSLPANPAEHEANHVSELPEISRNGLYVVYRSYASNLVPDDNNNTWDVFWVQRGTRATERVSVDSFDTESNGVSFHSTVDESGRYVAFAASASNLISPDTNATRDIFLRDRMMGTTTRIDGGQSPDARSQCPVISGDASSLVFRSEAANLVSGDGNNVFDLFGTDDGRPQYPKWYCDLIWWDWWDLDWRSIEAADSGIEIDASSKSVGGWDDAARVVVGGPRLGPGCRRAWDID